jgi:twitching motility protein PilT
MADLLQILVDRGGSDLHITTGTHPQIRIAGKLVPLSQFEQLTPQDTQRLAYSVLNEAQKQKFEEESELDLSFGIQGLARFRCNVYRQRGAVGAAIRVVPYKIRSFEELGLPKVVEEMAERPKGLVLVTGPTGSGKSTTLCALIDYINRHRSDHIITIEDPLEFVHENKKCLVNQRQVGDHTGSFRDALRAALREDPDVVLVGELRDLETMAMAIETAETGHLGFGTLHTSSAHGTIDRIINQFPTERQQQIRLMLADGLKGVISQMLCRKIGGGRVAALEIMVASASISNLIREGKTFQIPSIMQSGKKLGMCLMNDSFLDLVKKNLVKPEDAYAKAVDKSGLLAQFKRNGVDTSWAPKDAPTPGLPQTA